MSKLAKRESVKVRRIEKGKVAPEFGSFFRRSPGLSTARLPETGDPETNADQEVSAALAAILKERAERQEIYRLQTDVNYWFAVCFQSVEQKEAFLKAVGWDDLGLIYLDGLALAPRLGVTIEPIALPRPTPIKAAKKLRDWKYIELPESEKEGGERQ